VAHTKRHCTAAHSLSHLGPEGYHWRVMVEDKSTSTTTTTTTTSERSFSWWDIQDGNAKLPIKETLSSDLQKLLFPSKNPTSTTTDYTAAKAAKGAFKLMGKAMATAIGDDTIMGGDSSTKSATTTTNNSTANDPTVAVLVVKLLDLVKLHDEYAIKHTNAPTPKPAPPRTRRTSAPVSATGSRPPQQQSRSQQQPPQQQQQQQLQQQARPTSATTGGGHAPPQQQQQRSYGNNSNNGVMASTPPQAVSGDLMDFGDVTTTPTTTTSGGGRKVLHHAHSSPALGIINPNETRAQRLKREQQDRMKTINRVWDDVDQRWIVQEQPDTAAAAAGGGGVATGAIFGRTTSSSLPHEITKKKEIGIKLDMSNAVGKSASVQRAMSERVNEMEANRQKAVAEVKQREAVKKQREEEEDKIRQQLEPKIKAWAEEHGKKKQLTALLGTLHTILWPGATWKQVTIGDVLDPKKCKKIYFKATLVVHPDKTHDLPAEQRFLAKRIFDALTQAKTIYDQNGGR
jgi:hypothetical protein